MKKNNLSRILTVLIFAAVLTLPLLCVRLVGNDFSEAENRLLAATPVILNSDGSLNQSAVSEAKAWLEDHIGFRNEFIHLASGIKFHVFHQSPSEQVHIGKDGWYYYTLDENLKIATGEYSLTEETLERILEFHLAIRDKLTEKGIEYVIVLPTSKVSIYPEYLRYGDGKLRITPVDIVADYLEAHSDLRVVRLREILLETKNTEQVYFKTDTHWTQAGAYAAYREIIQRMTQWGLCSAAPVEAELVPSEYTGEFGDMMGVELLPEPTKVVQFERKAIQDGSSPRADLFHAILDAEEIRTPSYYYENSSVDEARVMLYGDSMFGGWNMTQLMAENFSEFCYVWDRNIRESLLDAMEPDIVIYELTERYLNIFPQTNLGFLGKPLHEFNSRISSFEWEDYLLRVTVENTSGETWREIDQVKLGLFSGGQDTGIRALLSIGQEVHPGESAVFEISLVEHPDLLSQPLEVGMLQEGIAYFPERKAVWPENLAKQTTDIPSNDVNCETANLLDIPYHEMVTEEEYGQWMGKQGICLDTCNDRNLGNGDLTVIAGESFLNIVGWGADFNAEAPFRELYLKVGENVVRCNYGIDRQSVVDHFQKETLRNTGFEVTIPASFITDGVTEISFIGVSADGTALYEPVVYQIRR